MAYRARLIDGERFDERSLADASSGDARATLADELSRTAAEGRPLPSTVELFDADDLLLVGALAPRKGCCSGWEITWRAPSSDDIVAIDRL